MKEINEYKAEQIQGQYIRLNANESNSIFSKGEIIDMLLSLQLDNFNRYPDTSTKELRKAYGKFIGYSYRNILAGNGSDQLIGVVISSYINKGDKILQSKSREIKHVESKIQENDIIDEDLERRENTIIAILLDSNANMFAKIKEQIKSEDFRDSINRKIAEQLYKELEKEDCNINRLIDSFDEETQNHITMVMATDYEIDNLEKAVDDILQKYEKEKVDNRTAPLGASANHQFNWWL